METGSNKISAHSSKSHRLLKPTLLLVGSMTVLAGAVIAPAIPQIEQYFQSTPHIDLISKLILTIPSLFIAILAPFAGQIIDKLGRKTPLIISLILYAVAGTSGLYLQNIYLIIGGRAALGIAVAGIMTINTTLIGDYFQGKERSVFMGWQGAFMAFGGVVFLSAGGLLADISWRMPFLIYGFSILILVLTIIFIYEPKVLKVEKKIVSQRGRQRRFKKYGLVFSTAFLGMLFFYMIPTQIPFLLNQVGRLNTSTIGYSISASVLAGAILSINYGKIRMKLNFNQIYVITFILMGAGFILIAVLHSFWGILTGLIVAGFGTGLFMPNTNLWLVSLAPAEKRGRLVGILNMAVYTGQFLSPVLFFPVIQWQSIGFSFGFCGSLLLLLALVFILENRARK